MKKILALTFMIGLIIMSACKEDDPPVIPDIPKITANPVSLSFGDLEPGSESDAMSTAISATDLTADVTVNVPADFIASTSSDGTFSTDAITIPSATFDNAGTATVYFKAVAPAGYEGSLTGDALLGSTGAENVSVALSVNVGINISGQLFMSEYLETTDQKFQIFLPLDSGIMAWNLNTDTVVNAANAGPGYPETTIPNNQVKSHWYLPVPLNGATLRATVGISASTSLAVSGYPVAPSGARAIVLDPEDASGGFNWINKNTGDCKAGKATGNTSAGRRFADDGYTSDLFMSALVNISVLGAGIDGKPDEFGKGDIIALANATSGPSNNNCVKIIAEVNGNTEGKFHFGLLKENEGNPAVFSTDAFDLSTTYVVVLAHEFVAGDNNDISKLYIFAEGDVIPTSMEGLTPDATLDDSYTAGLDPADLTIVYVRERRASVVSPTAEITGIRVGDTWVATLFEDAANAVNSNIDEAGRILTNEGSDCTL